MKWKLLILLLFCCFIFTGCGQPRPIEITGTITVADETIDKGVIQFVPADGNGPEGGGVIKNGQFTAKVFPGDKIVRIRGNKVTGKTIIHPFPDSEMEIDVEKPVTNSEHWEGSSLRVTIQKKNEPFVFKL